MHKCQETRNSEDVHYYLTLKINHASLVSDESKNKLIFCIYGVS